MWSNAGMANRQGDVDLRFAQVSAPVSTLAWLGLAWYRLSFRFLTSKERTYRLSLTVGNNYPLLPAQ